MPGQTINAIKEAVLKEITPRQGGIKAKAIAMVARINREIEKHGFNAVAVPGGSVAKDTFLKDDFDVDIFVKFDLSYQSKDLSRLLGKLLRPFKAVKVHGSRDYYQIKDGLHFEIVPVLDIRKPEQALNVTDMSPMHVSWVKERIRKRSGLADEIRLAKRFCKAAGVYGAESFIGGFSGHVLDILVIEYKGFIGFLRALSAMRKGAVIDPANFHKGKAKRRLNKAKLVSPLIVIDPILPERNAAAALTDEKFLQLKQAAKRFLKKPSSDAFAIRTLTAADLLDKAEEDKLIMVEAKPLPGKMDIVGSKLLKAYSHIKDELMRHDFQVKASDWQWDRHGKALFWYVLPREPLAEQKAWTGPLLRQKLHVAQFKKKHKETFERQGRIHAKVKRPYVQADQCVDALLISPYVTQRTASAKRI